MVKDAAILDVTVSENPFIPHSPTGKQAEFLCCETMEAFYGGAGGGGKSDALLMGALQYVTVPGYAALLIRRTYSELSQPKALIDRAHEWLRGTSARWNENKHTWSFPSGASLVFGYCENENDKYQYRSSEYQYIGFDELTEFSESQYTFLFSRLRRLQGVDIPLRMRSASNPGGLGHDWVKHRFIVPGSKDSPFFPATLVDNPYIDQDEYVMALSHLDPVTREQILVGDWDVVAEGTMFRRYWFNSFCDAAPDRGSRCRYWDLAASDPNKRVRGRRVNADPDWTVGALVSLQGGVWTIEDVVRDRTTPRGVEQLVLQTAQLDGLHVPIRMEQEPGSSGKSVIDHYARNILVGYDFKGYPSSGSKVERARPFASAAEAGNVRCVLAGWNKDFLDEVALFPIGAHDDQVDAVSGAMHELGILRLHPVVSQGRTYSQRMSDADDEIARLIESVDDPQERRELEAMLEEVNV
jgi:predicted phage terminase large subunit-like protein